MAEESKIGWTDSTVNWWWGCSHAGPGCLNCYAEVLNNFRGNKQWGPGAPRRKVKGAPALLAKLQRQAKAFLAEHGRKRRVFMQSMSDTFDNEVTDEWRDEMFTAIEAAPDVNVQLVTKRLPNIQKMASRWHGKWPRNVGLLITVVNQAEFDRDVPRLRQLKWYMDIPWVGLSIEPMLEKIETDGKLEAIDWVIVGCESGSNRRPFDVGWAEHIAESCAASGTALFVKQIPSGTAHPITDVARFPSPIRRQEFPEAVR